MKNNYIYILTALLLSISSCDDSFLDRYPKEELSDGSFWKSQKDAEMFVSNIYNVLPGNWSGDIDGDINSDNAVHGIKWAAGNVSKGIYDSQDFEWSDDYKYIRACNLVLSKIDLIPDLEATEKEQILAQTRFLRGYIYFTLIRSFGDVPYIEKPLLLTETEGVTRTARETVYNNIMDDFDYASDKLPVSWDDDNYGRITKGAALAMKARTALYYAEWETAASAAKSVMDMGKYELYDKDNTGKYAELFWEMADGNKEAVLVRQFNAPDNTNYIEKWGTFPNVGWGGLNPTQSLVDAFEDVEGAPITKSASYNAKNPFVGRDPRLEVNILHDGEEIYGRTIKVAPLKSSYPTGISTHNDATATGYYQQKWLDPEKGALEVSWDGGRDWNVIRYAEILLTYAEAKNEISGLDDAAFDAVNQVRHRVGMPGLQKTDASLPTYCATQDDLRQRIRNEWRVEFALEGGKRQWDIRRWGIAKEVLNAPFEGLSYKLEDSPNAEEGDAGKICILYEGERIKLPGSSYEDHNYVYPIPQSEIELNPNLIQNPGY